MRPTRLLTGLISMALLVVGLVALLPDCASACTCAVPPGSQQERAERALADAAAVFSGEVLDVEEEPPTRMFGIRLLSSRVTLRVSEVWKGPQRETLEVTTPRHGASCGYPFKEDQEYLVYVYGKEEPFKVNLCSETKPLSEARADLEALGNGEAQGGGGVLFDTSGGFPPLGIVGMMGLAVAAVSLVLLMRLVRTS
jgi:hypothetical protein